VAEKQQGNLFILSGPIDSGKTSALTQLVTQIKNSEETVAGVLSPKLYHNGKFSGYDLALIRQETEVPLARLQPGPGTFALGRFHFSRSAFRELSAELNPPPPSVFILDEIGPLELSGGGFASALPSVLMLPTTVLLTIREQCLTAVIEQFDLHAATVIRDYNMLSSLL
jgi:nucleoside-triphosphatase THEP1